MRLTHGKHCLNSSAVANAIPSLGYPSRSTGRSCLGLLGVRGRRLTAPAREQMSLPLFARPDNHSFLRRLKCIFFGIGKMHANCGRRATPEMQKLTICFSDLRRSAASRLTRYNFLVHKDPLFGETLAGG
jgi:hypothetical protein